jgi:hypothetical protein
MVIEKNNQALFDRYTGSLKSLSDCNVTSLGDGDYLYDLTNCNDVVMGFEDEFKRRGIPYDKDICLPCGRAFRESFAPLV